MISEQNKFPNNYRETAVFAHDNGRGDVRGFISHEAKGGVWSFESLVEMIKLYEALFDSANYPQPTHKLRGLIDEERGAGISILERNRVEGVPEGETPTFTVRIQYRQNASWQGLLCVCATGEKSKFRSALEFIKLIDTALSVASDAAWENDGDNLGNT